MSVVNTSPLRRRSPLGGPRLHDVICQTRALAPRAAATEHMQRPRGSSEPARVSGMLGQTHHRRQSAGGPAESARMRTSRRRHDGVRRAREPIRSGRGGAGLGWGGAGTLPRVARARCARIFRMTAGSCSVAIRRRRPPHWAHASTSMPNARCIRAAQLQARGLALHPGAVRTCGQRRRRGRGLGRHASVRDHALAPAGARGQHAVANQQVGFRPRRHRRQTLQEFQRLEHQLPRAVVPRRLQLQRDAAVAPQPQPLLREGRTQDISAQTLQPRPIVRRHPHVGVQVEPVQVRLPRPARRHGSPCRARRRAAAPAPPRVGPAPRAPAPRPRRSPPARGTRPRADPPAPSRRRPAPGRGAPAAAAPGGGSSPAPPRPRRRSAPAPDETPARPRALR